MLLEFYGQHCSVVLQLFKQYYTRLYTKIVTFEGERVCSAASRTRRSRTYYESILGSNRVQITDLSLRRELLNY